VDAETLEGLRILLAREEEVVEETEITERIIQSPMALTYDEFQESVFTKVCGEAGRGVCVQRDDSHGCRVPTTSLGCSDAPLPGCIG
jgi:hypothetical protein